jgi:alpha-L-fucosidase
MARSAALKKICKIPWDEYLDGVNNFCPDPDWAVNLVRAAKGAGARYITLTTRHHDGFSLYDTCGLNKYDAPSVCGRDLVREFVDACNEADIAPIFYHTLLDWHEESFDNDFPEYLKYLRKSVEILCKNYGRIGGFWFDGKWSKRDADWEEDQLYSLIRSYQPSAIIANNSGLEQRGAKLHSALNCVTYERGRPDMCPIDPADESLAGEMCQVFGEHWGYAARDFNFKSFGEIIRDLVQCRRYGCNYLINVGPKGDGSLRLLDRAYLETLGEWLDINGEFVCAKPYPVSVEYQENDFLLEGDNCLYLICDDLSMVADPNVAIQKNESNYKLSFVEKRRISDIRWLDDASAVEFVQDGQGRVTMSKVPFKYGSSMVVRIAKIYFE